MEHISDKYSWRDCMMCEERTPHVYEFCGNCAVIKMGNIVQEIERIPDYLIDVLRRA